MPSERLSPSTGQCLDLVSDIYEVSLAAGTRSYVWGGFGVDIVCGRVSREHGDLDCFTLGLRTHLGQLVAGFEARHCEVTYLEDWWMLKVARGDVHAAFNDVGLDGGVAEWHHAGPQGTVHFPASWLDSEPRALEGIVAYTPGARLLYALKTRVELLNPEWRARDKDIADIETLRRLLRAGGIEDTDIYPQVWSYTPYWCTKGYDAYCRPIVVG